MCMDFIDTLSTLRDLFLISNFHNMLLISYDIANDKIRTKFAKFIKKYGRRIQYSVYEIFNSDRVIGNIMAEIEASFEPYF